jgi:hypothetical protein
MVCVHLTVTQILLPGSPGRKRSGRDPAQCCQGARQHQQEQPDQHEQEPQPVAKTQELALLFLMGTSLTLILYL